MAFMFNGIGTTYYGKMDKRPDKSYVATLWFVIIFLPIFPVKSVRIAPRPGGVHLGVYSREVFAIQQELPLQTRQVLRTYLFVYGIIAALFALPHVINLFKENPAKLKKTAAVAAILIQPLT